jgi:hypothetical protein
MKDNKILNIVIHVTLLISTIALLSGCVNTTTSQKVLFDSGRGTGTNDNRTYSMFESMATFKPQDNLSIKSINPQINYCNGSCGYIIQLTDQNGQVLAYQTGLIDAKDQSNPVLPERFLNNQVQLAAQTEYSFFIRVWSTASVGIYTTGDRIDGIVGTGSFKCNFASSNLLFSSLPPTDNTDRGCVSFQLAD